MWALWVATMPTMEQAANNKRKPNLYDGLRPSSVEVANTLRDIDLAIRHQIEFVGSLRTEPSERSEAKAA